MQNENGVPEEDTVECYLKEDEMLDVVLAQAKSEL